MRRMLRHPGQGLRGSLERLSPEDRDLLLGNLHDLLQVVGVLVVDVTAGEDEGHARGPDGAGEGQDPGEPDGGP